MIVLSISWKTFFSNVYFHNSAAHHFFPFYSCISHISEDVFLVIRCMSFQNVTGSQTYFWLKFLSSSGFLLYLSNSRIAFLIFCAIFLLLILSNVFSTSLRQNVQSSWNFEPQAPLGAALAPLYVIWENNTTRQINSLITHSDSFSTLCPIN